MRSDRLRWGDNVSTVLDIAPNDISEGRTFARFLACDNVTTPYDTIMRSGRADDGSGIEYQVIYALQPQPGSRRWVEDTGRWFAGMDGRPSHAHGVIRVVTEVHEREQKLMHQAKFDELTGEVNRWHFTELLAAAATDAARLDRACAFLLIGIDSLSRINDMFGFATADQVIAAVAKRIRGQLRAGDVLGRFSGNKFGLILQNCKMDEMNAAADRLIAAVRDELVSTDSGMVAVTVTIAGVSVPRHGRTTQAILGYAQDTLASAKTKRPGTFLAYRPNLERDVMRRESVRASDEILAALNQRRLQFAFEPIANARTRAVELYECLVRTTREDGTILPAGVVVPIAEKLGLIQLIDQRLVELVVGELSQNPYLKLSLNVSPISAMDAQWWATLGAQLRNNPGSGERLTVEITEMTAIRDIDEARGFVNRVKDFGCRIAIDDFGAGYTSFRNLRKLGVDIIKIDGAFVQNLPRSGDDRAFVSAMLTLGHSLGLTTIAEWVQDEAAAALLTEYGCDLLQGELIGLATQERMWDVAPARIAV